MTGVDDPMVEGYLRGLIRANFAEPEAPIPECTIRDCETSFIGMTAEDYAVHLVESHSYYRNGLKLGSERPILDTVAGATVKEDEVSR